MNRILVLFAAAAVLAFIAYFVMTDRRRAEPRPARLERLERVGQPGRAASQGRETVQLVERSALGEPAWAMTSAVQGARAEDPSEAVQDPGPDKEQYSAEIQDTFARQPVTSTSRSVRADLSESLKNLQLADAETPTIDCRGSMCRADFADLDSGRAHDLLSQLTSITWLGPMTAFILDDERGRKSVRVFAAQKGAELRMPH